MSDIKSSVLYGAIIGDISGSPYERNPIKTKDYKFIRRSGHFTDDTVMTIAVAEALLDCPKFDEANVKRAVTNAMRYWGRKYPDAGYGHRFKNWLNSYNPSPYESFGNGAAMRVSAVALLGYISNNFDLVRDMARWITEVTHNHPEAVKSAEAVASAISLAQHGVPKDEIKSYLESEFGYDLSRTLDEIRPNYKFEVAAEKSVPEAIIAFLESTGFEDAIRNAVSLGGDADTQAAIAGSIAEAFYGVPEELKTKAREKLTSEPEMRYILDIFNRIAAGQDKCEELDGNEDLNDTMRLFHSTGEEVFGMDMFKYLCRQIKGNRGFIVAMKKFSEDEDSDNYKPLETYNERANYTFLSVFTNFYEFEKINREEIFELKYLTAPIKNLLKITAEINAETQNSDQPANFGIAINPNSEDVFYLPAELIDELLSTDADETSADDADETSTTDADETSTTDADETSTTDADETSADDTLNGGNVMSNKFSAEKSQAYKNLVDRAKNQYPVYNGSAPTKKVELFAPTVNGVNVCEEINLYTYWQGFGYAKKTPKIKYLLVAQDWGNCFDAGAESVKGTITKMNAGEDVQYPFSLKSPTDRNLIELFKILGRDITKPCDDVFFTNFCLGYRFGKTSGGMTKKLMMRDAELFRELCEILEPENILCLGRITSECVYEALMGEKFRKAYGDSKSYNDFLDKRPQIFASLKSGDIAQIYPLAHCGGMGIANRPLDRRQRADWKRIAGEQFDTIFRDALYINYAYPGSYPIISYLDSKGKSHNVELKKCLDKIFSRLPDVQNPETDDWKFFYSGMGYYFLVNKKVLDSYMRKTGIDKNACEIGFDEEAALETIAELKK